MTIETSMQVSVENQLYDLLVKVIRIDSIFYFFIRDKEHEKPLLKGRVLELTYTDHFSLTEFTGQVKSPGIAAEIINNIQQALIERRKLWHNDPL